MSAVDQDKPFTRPEALLSEQRAITRTVTVAGGRFAPGHLGELTQLVPFETVDAALSATRAVQCQLRDLPSLVVVYLVLAACLFPETGYLGVWRKLTGALAQARRRIGGEPLRWLFDLLRARPRPGTGICRHGLPVAALDGTALTVPDTPAVTTRFTKQAGNHGGTGYPQVRLLALVACGTRTLIDAVFGPITAGETTCAPRLLPSLRPRMILLADRCFGAQRLLADIAATGAEVLVRLKSGRHLLDRSGDNSVVLAVVVKVCTMSAGAESLEPTDLTQGCRPGSSDGG
ncbi:transposase domain-containing protein [Streptomyces sp. CLV115]|uniref:transposase domain-containing protein n=1 Tax=Streptomyces sp. CLV115 TaxID=3138502 RepID=UPI00313D2FF0